jgi:hypothetical protein
LAASANSADGFSAASDDGSEVEGTSVGGGGGVLLGSGVLVGTSVGVASNGTSAGVGSGVLVGTSVGGGGNGVFVAATGGGIGEGPQAIKTKARARSNTPSRIGLDTFFMAFDNPPLPQVRAGFPRKASDSAI